MEEYPFWYSIIDYLDEINDIKEHDFVYELLQNYVLCLDLEDMGVSLRDVELELNGGNRTIKPIIAINNILRRFRRSALNDDNERKAYNELVEKLKSIYSSDYSMETKVDKMRRQIATYSLYNKKESYLYEDYKEMFLEKQKAIESYSKKRGR